jgi:hypothetical protein
VNRNELRVYLSILTCELGHTIMAKADQCDDYPIMLRIEIKNARALLKAPEAAE